ncbi:alpha/beta fold hydrolase [Aspergillus ibericus CBS 121593]|uniref:AB hydrolase-1 domain-containing protein n=1 Tax=Aspergillus ibericus CBS 121593 TaxID=1448316 RepID=A0A395GIY5_9EURO|nr:hypothetical protein BO80DRAFT_469414 [Aspergillus ibericus CBS 121593]RAK95435.1 hypothetical protein BO80DRAFT_469414 [Aspergillus ibericus CBS 121593]
MSTTPPYTPITLTTKPTAQLIYSYHPPSPPTATSTSTPTLITFINGLGLPQNSWTPLITELQSHPPATGLPALLTYDRYAQGLSTDRDPTDLTTESHSHDCLSVVHDLYQLLTQIVSQHLHTSLSEVQLILVSNSIGGAISRLFAQHYPGLVAGMMFLDSVLAGSDFVGIYPDPDLPGFRAEDLPGGVTVTALRHTRAFMRKVFHPETGIMGQAEGFSRRNLPTLLPHRDSPKVVGPRGKGPWVTVIGHDFEKFEEEFEGMGGGERVLTREYLNPYWEGYNRGLVRITEVGRGRGPIRAPGAGHFVQRDNPDFVAGEVRGLVERVVLDGME